jgi:glutamate N-acetyltransferase/amino-acid N-acetyltransferase
VAEGIPGFRAAGLHCGLKPSGDPDLALIVSDRPAAAAAVFTRSRFPGAPVIVSRRRMRRHSARAVVINSRISNVAMGDQGLRDARRMTQVVAEELGIPVGEVQVSSTGVIGRPLPMDKIEPGIREAVKRLSPTGFRQAARAIMTTDTRPKIARLRAKGFSMLGIAKGSGMIMPDMATMLSFIVCDAAVEPLFLQRTLLEAVETSFNRLTIDGETSTSDTVLVMANGATGRRPLGPRSPGANDFRTALRDLSQDLTEQLAADGEGVTRIGEIQVHGARSDAEADRVARRVANSMLVKTALFGADPNWGRVVQAVGVSGVRFSPRELGIRLGGVEMLRDGQPLGGAKRLAQAERAMKKKRVVFEICLGSGPGRARVLTNDLGYEYVRINAEYTT